MAGPACVAADGTIVFGGMKGEDAYYALNSDGSLKWKFGTTSWTWGGPTIGPDGTIYLASGDGLYAIRGTSPLADSPWPMFHHDPQHTGRAGSR
jgi:outer membrane protein assembly factor BamB